VAGAAQGRARFAFYNWSSKAGRCPGTGKTNSGEAISIKKVGVYKLFGLVARI